MNVPLFRLILVQQNLPIKTWNTQSILLTSVLGAQRAEEAKNTAYWQQAFATLAVAPPIVPHHWVAAEGDPIY